MKLKLITLATVFAAGIGASIALANDGNGHGNSTNGCKEATISGSIPAQNLVVTVDKASRRLAITPGTALTLPLGGTGQIVRVVVQTCVTTTTSGTTTSVSYVVRGLEARVRTVQSTTTGTTTGATTTRKHGDDEHGDHGDKKKTTSTATTTVGTTTSKG